MDSFFPRRYPGLVREHGGEWKKMSAADAAPTAPGVPTLMVAAGRATLRLSRPLLHNRLEPADIDELARLLDIVDHDASVRVLTLRAEGKSFCAGYDLKDLATPHDAADHGGIGAFSGMLNRLEHCRVPTIAALNGPVYGGGTDLALACDFRLGLPNAKMFMPAGKFGLHYYAGGMRRYVTRLGLGAAKRLFLLAEAIDAGEMLRIGYLDQILPDEAALEARVEAMCAAVLAAASPAVIDSMKAVLNRVASADMDPAAADAAWTASRRSPEVAAAVAEALEAKRARGA
jgi:enoyl-CoA hydratase/carnithine racemase